MIHLKDKSTQWLLPIWNICHNKKFSSFQLVTFEINAIINNSFLFQLVAMNIYLKQLWELSEPIDFFVLYFLIALKEPVQINCKKDCPFMEDTWISTFSWNIY